MMKTFVVSFLLVCLVTEIEPTSELIGGLVSRKQGQLRELLQGIQRTKGRKVKALRGLIPGGGRPRQHKPTYKQKKTKPSYKPPKSSKNRPRPKYGPPKRGKQNRPSYLKKGRKPPKSSPNSYLKAPKPKGRDPNAESYGNALLKPGGYASQSADLGSDSEQLLSLVREMHLMVQQMVNIQNSKANGASGKVISPANQSKYKPNQGSLSTGSGQVNALPAGYNIAQASPASPSSQTSTLSASNSYGAAEANVITGNFNNNNNANNYRAPQNSDISGNSNNVNAQASQVLSSVPTSSFSASDSYGAAKANVISGNFNNNNNVNNRAPQVAAIAGNGYSGNSITNSQTSDTTGNSNNANSYINSPVSTLSGNINNGKENDENFGDTYGRAQAAPVSQYNSVSSPSSPASEEETIIRSTFDQMLDALTTYRDQQEELKLQLIEEVRRRRKTEQLTPSSDNPYKPIRFPINSQLQALLAVLEERVDDGEEVNFQSLLNVMEPSEQDLEDDDEFASSLHVDSFFY